MLAEGVLRPPDVRPRRGLPGHRRVAASRVEPQGSLGDMFATRCATCGRTLVADEVVWQTEARRGPSHRPALRCTVCRDKRGGGELREAELDPDDLVRATADVGAASVRARARRAVSAIDGAPELVDELLDLHSPRQLVGLAAIMARVEGDLRAPGLAALRLAVLDAILPASRLTTGPGRTARCVSRRDTFDSPAPAPRGNAIRGSRSRTACGWSVDSMQGLEGEGSRRIRPGSARTSEPRRGDRERAARARRSPAAPGRSGLDGRDPGRSGSPRVRLVLAQPPLRPAADGLAAAYHAAAWVLGREAALLVPAGALAGASLRAPWSWQAAAIGRTLESIAPAMARDGRVVLLVDGGSQALVSAVLGGSSAGFRLVTAKLADAEDDARPGGAAPPNAALPPVRGPGRTWRCRRYRAAPGIPTSSPVRACSRPPSGSTSARSRRWRRRARCPRPRSRC